MEEKAVKKRLIINGQHVDDFWLKPVLRGDFEPKQDFGTLRPDIDDLLAGGSVRLRTTPDLP